MQVIDGIVIRIQFQLYDEEKRRSEKKERKKHIYVKNNNAVQSIQYRIHTVNG